MYHNIYCLLFYNIANNVSVWIDMKIFIFATVYRFMKTVKYDSYLKDLTVIDIIIIYNIVVVNIITITVKYNNNKYFETFFNWHIQFIPCTCKLQYFRIMEI